MYRHLSTQTILFPAECCNCNLRRGTSRYEISSWDPLGGITRRVSAPICDTCLAETKNKSRRNTIYTILIVAQFLFFGFIEGVLFGNNPELESVYLDILFFILGFVLPVLEYWFLITRQKTARFDFFGNLHFRNTAYQTKVDKLNKQGNTPSRILPKSLPLEEGGLQPRTFSQIFLSLAKIFGISIIPILLLGALVLSISGIDDDPILWLGCLSLPIFVALCLAAIMAMLGLGKEIYRVFPYSLFDTNQVMLRKRLVDEKLTINSNHYRIVYSNDNEFHFQFRMSPKLRIRLLNDRAEVVGAQSVVDELGRLFEKLPKSHTNRERYIHSTTSGTCYLCGESYKSGEGYLAPITVAFTSAFRYLVSSASDNENVAVRRSLLQKIRQSSSPHGNMETPTQVCPECAHILS